MFSSFTGSTPGLMTTILSLVMPLSIANVRDQAVFPAFFFFIGAMAAVETQSQTTLHEDT